MLSSRQEARLFRRQYDIEFGGDTDREKNEEELEEGPCTGHMWLCLQSPLCLLIHAWSRARQQHGKIRKVMMLGLGK